MTGKSRWGRGPCEDGFLEQFLSGSTWGVETMISVASGGLGIETTIYKWLFGVPGGYTAFCRLLLRY